MLRDCGANAGGRADGTLMKRPTESARRSILGAIMCITVTFSQVEISQATSNPRRRLDKL